MFLDFCTTAERIGATTKRLEKAAILGEYFKVLSDEDLTVAARYFAGRLFPLRESRVVNVGGALLLSAIQIVTQADDTHLRERLVVWGDHGDAAQEAFAALPERIPELTLGQVAGVFETLATTSGTGNKLALITELLRRATPLEAKYAVKLLANDLRIGLKEGAVEDAIARGLQVKVGEIQRVNMLTGDIGEVALRARHGTLDEAKFELFHPITFMLATPAADLADVARQMPEQFVVEDKYDGIRAQAHIAPHVEGDSILHGVTVGGRRIALFSRTLDEITRSFPDVHAPLAALLPEGCDGLVLDGELVPFREGQILPFQELQLRLNRKTLSEELLARVPVAFIAYDALYKNRILLDEALGARRGVLETLTYDGTRTLMGQSATFADVTQLDEEFDAARARGNEGLMIKDPRSQYKPGRRGREWLKLKKALATLDVVVTAVEVGSGRRSKFLSDYTFAVRASESDSTLLNVGKAYSGLTDGEVQELSEWFTAHTLHSYAHGKVRVVEPQVVLEITFDRVQPSPRHKSGFALRFPRIVRVRHDKPASEVDTLDTVQKLAEI